MTRKNETEQNIKKLEALQTKIADLKQEEKSIQEKIIHHFAQALHHYNGFTVPVTVITGALIKAIETYKQSPENTGDWQEAGEKFLKVRSRNPSKKAQ